jgi:hypothetical protein
MNVDPTNAISASGSLGDLDFGSYAFDYWRDGAWSNYFATFARPTSLTIISHHELRMRLRIFP